MQEHEVPFPSQRNDRPIVAIFVRLLLHFGREGDCTHDAIAKLLIQDGLVRETVILDDLVQAVDERLPGRHIHDLTSEGKSCQLGGKRAVLDVEDLGQLLHVLIIRLRLSVEDGGDGDFIASEVLGNILKGHALLRFGIEEGVGLDGHATSWAGQSALLA